MSPRTAKQLPSGVEPSVEHELDGELPEGWVSARIAQLAQTQSGGTPATSNKAYWEDGDVPWINSGALKDCVISEPSTCITRLGLKESSAKLFPPSTVVIALTGATTGRVGLLDFECSTNQSVTGILPSPSFIPDYLFQYLRFARDSVLERMIGSAQPHINKRIVDDIKVPIPPLAEQRRIVVKLEELLGKVSSSQQRLSRVPGLLKRFRQSVLAAACSGRLTADWRESYAPLSSPEELNDEIRKFAATKPKREIERAKKARSEAWPFDLRDEIPTSWLQASLIDVTSLITCGVAKRPEYVEKGIPFLSAQNAKPFRANLNDIKYISEKDFRTFTVGGKPERGDVLYSRVGAKFGEAAKIPFDFDFAIYVSLTLIKPVRRLLDPDFLVAFLNSHYGMLQAHGGILGSGIQNLNVENVRKYIIPLPPLSEQQEIVRRVEKLFGFADQIERRLSQAQGQVDRLTQSLLGQAFRGELVPTEATLARRESRDYESATELLHRIRSTATNATTTKARRSGKR
jgi:type I restriction enzyme S subunit